MLFRSAKIKLPLGELLESQWKPFVTGLNELEGVVSQSCVEEFSSRLERSLLKNNEIVAALKSILGDMIEIQDLNEIIDRVRGLLDEQSKAVDRSKQEQKKLNLDSLK